MKMDPKYIIELTVKLFATCVVVAGLLGVVNQVTAPNIAAINKAKTEADSRAAKRRLQNSLKGQLRFVLGKVFVSHFFLFV